MQYSVARCFGKEAIDMGIPAAKVNFERELQRRKKERESIQSKLDFEELTRRLKDMKDGKDPLIDEDEFWDSIEKMGY
jgi:hypothetical protein